MSWSLSSISTYEKCALQYKFRYIDKIESQTTSAAASRGTEIHGSIESFLTGATEVLPNEISYYNQFLTDLRGKTIYPEHKVALTREWEPTEWGADNRWYKGILDLKVVDDPEATEATVIDWKTGKVYPEHEDQKSIYSLAVFSEHPSVLRVRAQHVYVDLGKTRETIYDRQQVHELRTKWNSRVLKLEEEKDWIPNPSFKCRFCSYSKEKGGPCRF